MAKKFFTHKQEITMRRHAVKLGMSPSAIKAVVIARNVTIAKAVKLIEQLLNESRESRFDF